MKKLLNSFVIIVKTKLNSTEINIIHQNLKIMLQNIIIQMPVVIAFIVPKAFIKQMPVIYK